MPYYLVPMVANARPGPFGRIGTHPLSLDYGGNAVILDETIAYGWTPDPIPDPRATWICNEGQDLVTGQARAALQALVPGRVMGARFHNIVGDMLKTPPAAGPHRWNPLTPHLGRKQLEILLGPGNFLGPGVGNPGLLWSEPVAGGGPHSKNLTDTFNRADGALNGSTSSDGLFAWSGIVDATAVTVVSNQAKTVRAGTDMFPLYVGSVPMDTADAYSWTAMSGTGTAWYCGPILRNTNGTGSGSGTDTGYFVLLNNVTNDFVLYAVNLAGGDSVVASVSAAGVTSGNLYLQFVGSTFYAQRNGVTLFSGTNTISDGSAGHRKVGFLTCAAGDNTSVVTIDNFFAADITVDTRITPAAGALALTGYAPSPGQSNPGSATFMPSTGRLNLSDKNPILTPLPGALVVAGQTPTLPNINLIVLTPNTGALAIAGAAPTTQQQGLIRPPTGAVTLAGQSVNVSRSLAPAAGALTLTGNNPQVVQLLRVEITPSTGRLTLSLGTTLRPDAGVLTITGSNPSLGVVRPGAGALNLTGIVPIVFSGGSVAKTPGTGALWFGEEYVDTPPTGAMSITGAAPALLINALRIPGSGALVLDGQPPFLPGPALIPGTGSLTIVGQQAAASRSLAPGTGTLTFTGVPAVIGGFVQAIPVPGVLTLQGYAPLLNASGLVTLRPGTGALTIDSRVDTQPPPLQFGVICRPDSGALVLASDPPDIAGLRIVPDAADLALVGYAPRLFVETKFRPGTGALVLAGHAPNVGDVPPQGGRRFHVPPPRRGRFQTAEHERED